jgi:hypothetical protein
MKDLAPQGKPPNGGYFFALLNNRRYFFRVKFPGRQLCKLKNFFKKVLTFFFFCSIINTRGEKNDKETDKRKK